MGDALSDIRGESFEPLPSAPAPEPPGLASQVVSAWRDVILGAQDTIGGVFTGAQNTIGGAVAGGQQTVQTIALGGQQTVEDIVVGGQQTVAQVLNPLGLLGLGTGLSFGGVVAMTGIVGGGALLVDELTTGGLGRMALMRKLSGKRR